MGRMMSPDPYVIGSSTQGFNRYSYALNNPLRYNDPDGKNPIVAAALIGAVVSAASFTVSVALSPGGFDNWNWNSLVKNMLYGAASGVVTAGIGSVFGPVGSVGHELLRAGAHGLAGGGFSAAQGGSFGRGFLAGAFGSVTGSIGQGLNMNFEESTLFSAAGGAAGSMIGGGNPLEGAATGILVNALNHLQHDGGDGDDEGGKRTKGKGNTFRAGSQKQRDGDLAKIPAADRGKFKKWYHDSGNSKHYKLKNQPDPDIMEPYKDWLKLGKPHSLTPVIIGVGAGAYMFYKYGGTIMNFIGNRIVVPIILPVVNPAGTNFYPSNLEG